MHPTPAQSKKGATHPILLVVHDNLLQRIQRACSPRSRTVNLSVAGVSILEEYIDGYSVPGVFVFSPKGSFAKLAQYLIVGYP